MTALEGLRVLDLTQVMAGPYCCQILADMGADVIKVEPVGSGDSVRTSLGPRLPNGESAAFLAVNRNKRGIALDLKSEPGLDAFKRLVGTADVVVENFRPGVVTRLGIDYESLRRIKPDLIYASISGFGQTGPYADRPGYDLIAQGMSGIMSISGEPGGNPVKSGIPVADLSAGMFCAVGILGAVVARGRTGDGQYIDTSLYDSALALSIWETSDLWANGRPPGPFGSAHRFSAPYQALRTRDGHITVGANNAKLWTGLCRAMGRDDLLEDPRFGSNEQRMGHRDELTHELELTLKEADTEHWVAVLLAAGVPAGPIRDYRQVVEDEHTIAREMVVSVSHPIEGEVLSLGTPIKLSGTPAGVRSAAPTLGQHTDEVLGEAGYDSDALLALRTNGRIG